MMLLRERFHFPSSQADRYGSWKPSALMVMMQEMAGQHGALLGLGREDLQAHHAIWVLFRNEFQLLDSPAVGEPVIAETWPGQPRRTLFPRYHRFLREDGSVLALGVGMWTMADTRTQRMALVPELLERVPDTGSLEPPMGQPQAVQRIDAEPMRSSRMISFCDFDHNQHVNNTRCGDWALDLLGESRMKTHYVSHFVANYDRQILTEGPVELALRQREDGFSLICQREGQTLLSCGGSLSPRPGSA